MNTPQYRQQYMNNLKMEISNNNRNLNANRGQPAVCQFLHNTNQSGAYNPYITNIQPVTIKPVSSIQPMNLQAKGTKFNGFK